MCAKLGFWTRWKFTLELLYTDRELFKNKFEFIHIATLTAIISNNIFPVCAKLAFLQSITTTMPFDNCSGLKHIENTQNKISSFNAHNYLSLRMQKILH